MEFLEVLEEIYELSEDEEFQTTKVIFGQ